MKRPISCLLLSLLLSFPLRGQIHTKQLPVADRLPSNSIKRLLQDSEGYIWMATLDGICRYDAYRVMNFRLNYMAGTVDAPSINHISEDSCRRIWIAHSKGIILLDKRNYSLSALNDDAFRGKNIKSVFTASNGDVWVGAETNLYCYPAAGKPLGEKKLYGTFAGDINSFCEDREGALWFTTWREGMYRLRQNDTLFVRYPPIGANDNPHKIYQDNTGQHWVCTWNDGLYRFHPHRSGTGMYERIRAVDKDSALHGNIFFNVVRDDTYGYIWALSHTGMYVLKPGIRPGDFVEAGIPPAWSRITNLFYDIMKDRDGNLWLGSVGGGALTIELSDSRFRHYNLDEIPATTGLIPNITALCESKDRVLWMNQNRLGICLLYPGSGEIMSFSNLPALNKIEHLRSVNCISRVDGSEEIWAGASYDPVIYCFHQSGKNVLLKTTVNLSDLSPSATSPLRILEDRSGHVWVHTEDELFCRNLQGQWSLIERVEGKISGLTEGRDSSIWVSTCEQGLYRFTLRGEKQHLRVETSRLPDNHIQILSSDSCRIWIITGDNRLFAFLPEHPELFREYTLEHLPSGEAVNDLVSDPMGHLWISTNKCVIEFNPSNGASVDYSRADGLPVNMFIKGSTATTASGEILFGGNQGVCRFIPSEALDKSSRNTPVKICDIKVNNHSIYEENKAMDKPNQSLRLRPSDKTVELAFSSLYYMSPGKIRYAYRLDGVDNDWIYAAEDRRFAVYNQLRKGRYTFRVKATGKNGLWDEQETEINIIKLPDFYETPQACLLYICLVCGIAFVSLRVASNRIKLRNKLKIAQIEKEKSEELIQTKLRYFTNISHDLLTPLSIMSCVVDEACPSVEQTEVLRSNIDRLKRLLQQILDFRKVESGNMKLKVSQEDIVSFIRRICNKDFSPLILRNNIAFSFDAEPDCIMACFDADKVDKIVFNLLSNAFKYTPKNGFISVLLRTGKKDGHRRLSVKISDTGTGIPAQDIPGIFTRFFNNNLLSGESNGIGLSLTKDLVELHHGSISVESKPGEGSVFTVEIPIDKECYLAEEHQDNAALVADTSDSEAFFREVSQPASGAEQIRAGILLVEDNEELLHILAMQFVREYRVYTATHGNEALQRMSDADIDIVVSDVVMPGMDGLELCRKIKNNLNTSHIAVLLLTAKNSMDDRVACYEAGADAYISKPFAMKVLRARINNLIFNKQKLQQEFKSDVNVNISTLEYRSLDEKFLDSAIRCIENHLSQVDFDIETLASDVGMSKSSLYRKIKSMTGLSPHEFIRNIKLKHACRMLKSKPVNISEVAYAVGFSTPKYFAACFKSEFGITPTEYQKK